MSSENKTNLTHSQPLNVDQDDSTEEITDSSTEEILNETCISETESEPEFYIPTAIPHWLTLMMEEDYEDLS